MRIPISETAAYVVLILAVIISGLLGAALPSLPGIVLLTAGGSVGVLTAARIGRPSYVGVGLVVFLLTVVAPVALVYTSLWQIAASALVMGAESVPEPGIIDVPWFVVLPTLIAVLALWAHRHLTFHWSGR